MSLRPLSLVVGLAWQIKKKKRQKKRETKTAAAAATASSKAAALPLPLLLLLFLLSCFCFVFQYGCDQATSVGKRLLTPQPSCFNISNYAFCTTLLPLSLTLLLSLLVSWGPANLLAATRGNGPHSLSFSLFKIVIAALAIFT